MTENDMENTATPAPVAPKGAQEVLWGLGGFAFLALVLCLAGYHAYGAQLTQGLDRACAEAAFEAGQKFEAAGNLAQAVLKYRQAMDGRFENEALRHMCGRAIGDLLFKQDRYEEAVAAYEALPAGAFDHVGAYTGYVTALWHTGAHDRARALGDTWLAMTVEAGDGDQEIWARNVLMHIARDKGDNTAALEHGLRILERAPGNDAAITVARILREQGKTTEARAHAEALLEATESPALRDAARDLLQQLDAGANTPDAS